MTKLLKREGDRRPHDTYETPPEIAAWVVRRCLFLLGGDPVQYDFIEPGCGDFAPFAVEAAKLNMVAKGIDIRSVSINENLYMYSGIDFLKYKFKFGNFDIIATNPPFSHLMPFWH